MQNCEYPIKTLKTILNYQIIYYTVVIFYLLIRKLTTSLQFFQLWVAFILFYSDKIIFKSLFSKNNDKIMFYKLSSKNTYI